MSKLFKRAALISLLVLVGIVVFITLNKDARRSAQIKAVDKMGDIATKRMANNDAIKGTAAADFINIPIEAREISPGIFQATGVGNAHLITTDDGNVLFDTGLATQVPKQMKVLKAVAGDSPPSKIIISHSHADHSGGVKFWQGEESEIIAHQEFSEEQRYLTELQPYFWHRNRTLFPFLPEKPPSIGLIAYGGITPSKTVHNGSPYAFTQGGRRFELLALSGAEGSDNLVMWMPDERILFSGDLFGPNFPQFPNIFTMRGEKVRRPVEYVNSLNTIIDLNPATIVPSHKAPISDPAQFQSGLVKMRDATQYVHDQTVAGMNAGKTLEQVMREVQLPPELNLSQEHGRVSWGVKSIWEYYSTWFHFDKTTELYPVPIDSVYGDITRLAGAKALSEQAQSYLDAGEPLKALHLCDIVLGSDVGSNENNGPALRVRKSALETLLSEAQSGLNNSYEIDWLKSRIRATNAQIEGLKMQDGAQ